LFDADDQRSPAEKMGLPPEPSPQSPELSAKPPEQAALCLEWSALSPTLQTQLVEAARPVSGRSRVKPSLMMETVLSLCTARYLGLRVLAQVLQRDPDDLRKRTLIPMVKTDLLRTAFSAPNDPRQAYTAVNNNPKKPP
jgi:hypothetical protein